MIDTLVPFGFSDGEGGFTEVGVEPNGQQHMELSSDLGQTPFNAEIKASELNRWIAKAFANGEFICINKAPEMEETFDEQSNLAGTV